MEEDKTNEFPPFLAITAREFFIMDWEVPERRADLVRIRDLVKSGDKVGLKEAWRLVYERLDHKTEKVKKKKKQTTT